MITQKLASIQQKLKAPKNNYNSFGKYKYRSCEDILEAVKPLLDEAGCTMSISDDIVSCEGRVYVKATVKIHDVEGKEEYSVSAFAREPEEKKGMDASQVTGTASSYARKYALNGLFLIDDTKDADTDEFYKQTNQGHSGKKGEKPKPTPAPKQEERDPDSEPVGDDEKNYIKDLCSEAGLDVMDVCQKLGVNMIVSKDKSGAKTKTFTKAGYIRMKNHLENHLADINDLV